MKDRTKNENAPLERGGFSATTTKHEANHSANRDAEKDFSTLRAKFALVGHTLYRTVDGDGTILYRAGKWGYVRELSNLEAVVALLAQIGGRA